MTDLHAAIDAAGSALLKRCEAVGEDGKPLVGMGQHTEAFLALIKWAEIKSKITPAQPQQKADEDGKFERIKGEFHGKKRNPGNPWGRRGKPITDGETERGTASTEGIFDAPVPSTADGGSAATDEALTEH